MATYAGPSGDSPITSDVVGLPLRFSNLSIAAPPGRPSNDELLPTVGSTVLDIALLGPIRRTVSSLVGRRDEDVIERYLIESVEGVVQQGEMLLIVGPPDAPTSLLLRALSAPDDVTLHSNSRIDYGLLSAKLASTSFLRSSVVYLPPHDVHFPALTVSGALTPCAKAKKPRGSVKDWAEIRLHSLLQSVGLSHAVDTPFGSQLAMAHGLSGGETKRASLVEVLLTDAAVLLLDSPTSGLDSSTALDLLRFLRETAHTKKKSIVVTSPQISDRLLEQFDKVLVLSGNGTELFFGPATRAKAYFEGLGHGLSAGDEETVAFLAGCAVKDPSLHDAWIKSQDRETLLEEMEAYAKRYPSDTCKEPYTASVQARKSRWLLASSRWTVPFWEQVALLTRRQYALVWAEVKTYGTKTAINLLLSLLVGTLFWRLPPTTNAAFTRGSLLLLSIMFNAYLSLAELGKTIEGRTIVKRQSDYGFFGSSALALARIAGDLPLIGVQVVLFGTVTYLCAGLQPSFERFAVYIIFVYATALNLSCMFRLFAAFSPSFEIAIRFCGIALNILVILAGYFIPAPLLPRPLQFIHYYVDPISRAYESVLTNEFRHLVLECSPSQIVPTGPTYGDPYYQTCLLPGSVPHSLQVSGSAYLADAYDFHYENVWYNLLVMTIQALVFLFVAVLATEWLHFAPAGSKRVWARTKRVRKMWSRRWDKEEAADGVEPLLGARSDGFGAENEPETSVFGDSEPEESVEMKGSVLVWKSVSLWVDTELETRRLLDRISGCIRPGRVCALLGASGAGKSTLLNALAGRSQGSVRGTILVNGRPPSPAFYRTTGFVDQFDLFDEKSTVRESLEFSALLRQDRSIPRAKKLAYVDVVLDLLDLSHLSDAIVGTPTAGLDLCSRKLLSIAVEVVSRPTILFADEPTTSLDARSALRVVKLLRRLAHAGLPVLATIHQPSREQFATFDDVLLLQRGGKQLYFGDRAAAAEYFSGLDTGVSTKHSNAADLLLEIAGSRKKSAEVGGAIPVQLADNWRESSNAKELATVLDTLSQGASTAPPSAKSARRFTQCIELTKRVSRHLYRDVSYSYTKLFTSSVVPLVVGFAFFQVGREHTLVSFQNRMFSVFLLLFVPVVVMNVTIFKVVQLRGLWHARELPGKIYGRTAFATSLLVSDVPYSLLCATVYFLLWYLLAGFPLQASTMLYSFALIHVFWVFQSTWALWIVSLSNSLGIIANLLPFFLVSMEAFNGSLMPYAQMPIYWKWLYWVSPFQWYVRGMLGVLLHNQPVVCGALELVKFATPPGQTCAEYAADYLVTSSGVLLTPDSTTICTFCEATVGDDWLHAVNINYEDRWLALGVLAAYAMLNIVLFYLLVYFPPRVPIWLAAKKSGRSAEEVAQERWDEELDEAEEAAGGETLVAGTRDAFT